MLTAIHIIDDVLPALFILCDVLLNVPCFIKLYTEPKL